MNGRWLVAGLVAWGPGSAAALDLGTYDVHGFAAQGYALSDGANYIGDSTHGTPQYFELGVNAALETPWGLRVAAQELVRRAGQLDDGELELDYGFVDYPFDRPGFDAGLRAGRVKNPYGLFNETRDVIFTRPGILLPLSVYFDTQPTRSLLFSSDGGQAYAGWSVGKHYASLVVTRAADFTFDEEGRRALLGPAAALLLGDVDVSEMVFARLMDDWSAGVVRIAVSYVQANLEYRPDPADAIPAGGDLDARVYVLSAAYRGARLGLTGEYQLTELAGSLRGAANSHSDGAYLQLDYRFSNEWGAMARVEGSFRDRSNRDGGQCPDASGAPRDGHECYALVGGVGLRWTPDPQWGVWAEYHRFDGSALAPPVENQGGAVDPHSGLALLMAGYRF